MIAFDYRMLLRNAEGRKQSRGMRRREIVEIY